MIYLLYFPGLVPGVLKEIPEAAIAAKLSVMTSTTQQRNISHMYIYSKSNNNSQINGYSSQFIRDAIIKWIGQCTNSAVPSH